MSLEKIIKKTIHEQIENVVRISPEDFKENLIYFNSDVALLKKYYKNKDIIITGDLDLSYNTEVKNLNYLTKVLGELDISYSNVDVFDDGKATSIRDWNSKRSAIRKQKELDKKLDYLNELRKEEAWDLNNGKLISYETDAIFQYLKERGTVGTYENENEEMVEEDKYFLFPEKYKHYGNGKIYTWLGENKFESDYIVYDARNIESAAYESLEQRVDELGFDAFSDWVWKDNFDENKIRSFLEDYISDDIRDNPEDFEIEKTLSDEQEKQIEIFELKIERLNNQIQTASEERKQEIYSEIDNINELIEDITEDPQGDYDDEEIEREIENWVNDHVDDFESFYEDLGYPEKEILDFVDMDAVFDFIISHDSWGDILGSYDGSEDTFDINGLEFIVMRYN